MSAYLIPISQNWGWLSSGWDHFVSTHSSNGDLSRWDHGREFVMRSPWNRSVTSPREIALMSMHVISHHDIVRRSDWYNLFCYRFYYLYEKTGNDCMNFIQHFKRTRKYIGMHNSIKPSSYKSICIQYCKENIKTSEQSYVHKNLVQTVHSYI